MALPHAQPLDIIDVGPLAGGLKDAVSTSLIKTGCVQLLHLVMQAHEDQPEHHVHQECVIHCLEGIMEVVWSGGVRRLETGHLVVLSAQQKHSLRARTDCAVLVTLLLEKGDSS